MNGFQLTFFTVQRRVHAGKPLAEWLIETARAMDFRGATAIAGVQGLSHDGGLHAVTLFDQADQPVQVILVATAEEAERFLSALNVLDKPLYYVKTPVEFGCAGKH
ncbi:PII-like signaling protein [Rhodoblastus acidophilus]|uniref:DUF190 domain-containing protein n=1 Tax=Rhodoblastus acidophilus TaxID=1074 RepID=UPI002223FCEC|nr:DUF190 domain-containing protein [Rhodoblastus acidophilus]MCW2318995.1 PII-like signaling protein [Rhodoblastus acidophilus]